MMENKPTFVNAVALTPCLPERESLANAFDLGQELQCLLAETQMLTEPVGDVDTATLIPAKGVIPAEAGIQATTGFRVKPGMTN